MSEFLREKFKPDLKGMLANLYDYYVYIDGKFVRGEEAKISVWDHGLLYGDGVYEGIRAYDGKVFKLDEHINRLYDSAKAMKIDNIPLTKDEFKQAVIEALRRNNLRDAHIRPIITRGSGRPGLDPRGSVRPSVIILTCEWPPYFKKPVRLMVSSVRRKSPHSIDAKIKCLNYLDSVLAKIQAISCGFDDAIMLDINSVVAECTGENVFVIKGRRLHTPFPIAALHGIMRETVMELALKLGYEAHEKDITIQELYTADEVFLTGTGAGMVPVVEIDGRKIGVKCPGPITQEILDAFNRYIREEHVTPIYE